MKLVITIDAPEKEIRECVEGIPPHFFDPRFTNPLRIVARAMRDAYRKRDEEDNPRCFCPDCGADLGSFYSNRIRMVR